MFSFNEYLILLLAFTLGSIPFGAIIVKINGLGNISEQGSGNIGATNVVRVAGKKLGIITFTLDFFKGLIPTLLCQYIFPENHQLLALTAILAVLGHMFTPWLKFKGGKGVATGLAVILSINHITAIACIITWVVSFKLTRISSVSAIISYSLMPFYLFFADKNISNDILLFAITLSILVFIKHIPNIKRLLEGNEGNFKKAK